MRAKNVSKCEKTQKEPEPNVWNPKDFDPNKFYRGNYGKMYHLPLNGYGEVDPKYNFHNNPKIVECKRVSYSSFDKKKTHWRDFIDRIIIDADEGYKTAVEKLRDLIDELKFEYWIIAGTDKPEKPQDSGSIVIMFQEVKATKENRDKFNNLMHCFNLYVGDPLNTGYSHKAPEWKGTNLVKEIPGSILDFDELYRGVLNFYNHTPKEVETLYKEREMCEYDKKFDVEVQKGDNEISGNKLSKYYEKSHKTEEQTALIQLFLNDREKSIRISNRKATGEVLVKDKKSYMRRLMRYQGKYFDDSDYRDENIDYRAEYKESCANSPWDENLNWLFGEYEPYTEEDYLNHIEHHKFIKPMSFREKFNVSEKEEEYWRRREMKKMRDDGLFETKVKDGKEYENYILHKRRKAESIKLECLGLGFTEDEVNHIMKKIEVIRAYERRKKDSNRKEKVDRIIELNGKKLNGTIHPDEIEELKELTKPKEKEEKGENGFPLNGTLYDEGYNGNFSYNKKVLNKGKRKTYYIDKNNYVLTKQYVIDNYFGGKETKNFNKQIKQYSIVSISQSEILKSNGKYKLSPDVNMEIIVSNMHEKIIKDGNQLKPSKK
jgi:hypothetical protein